MASSTTTFMRQAIPILKKGQTTIRYAISPIVAIEPRLPFGYYLCDLISHNPDWGYADSTVDFLFFRSHVMEGREFHVLMHFAKHRGELFAGCPKVDKFL